MDERKEQGRTGGREGFGDDGGARVGRPDAGQPDDRSMARLSEGADDRGLEGAVLDESQGARSQRRADGSDTAPSSMGVQGQAGGRGTLDQSQREQSGMSATGAGGATGGAANVSGAGSTGAGAEGAQGIHNRQEQKGTTGGTDDRAGSEPLEGRGREHKPSYGGEGGSPRTSSDQRENPSDPKLK